MKKLFFISLVLGFGLTVLNAGEGIDAYNKKDYETAKEAFAKECDMGHKKSCRYLGGMFEKGIGVQTDEAEALNYYKQGCRQKDYLSCQLAGAMYENGRGTYSDEAKAKELYVRACKLQGKANCDKGSSVASSNPKTSAAPSTTSGSTSNLVADRKKGDYVLGVEALIQGDYEVSRVNFERVCRDGNADACSLLGEMYIYGRGVKQSDEIASKYYAQSCDKGYGYACVSLAKLYEAGKGVSKDEAKAKELYKKACKLKVQTACGK